MPNKGSNTKAAPKRSSRKAENYNFIEENRTYTREELQQVSTLFDKDYIPLMQEFFGLVPLGNKTKVFHGRNAIEAMDRHARGEIVESEYKPLTREELQAMRKNK